MTIVLKSEPLIVVKIKTPTSAKMFNKLEVGDVIHMSIEIKHLGSNRGRTYASYIKITNYFSGESIYKSFNQLSTILQCFELQ